MRLRHEFVDYIPEELANGVVYVSIRFGTVVHRCACGCGEEVVTPLGPAEWKLTYDGRVISLAPSIGNWSFACRSHYWIEDGYVRWARDFSSDEVTLVRREARASRDGYYATGRSDVTHEESSGDADAENKGQRAAKQSLWKKLLSLGRGLWRGEA